jgi:hypothetical protein
MTRSETMPYPTSDFGLKPSPSGGRRELAYGLAFFFAKSLR